MKSAVLCLAVLLLATLVHGDAYKCTTVINDDSKRKSYEYNLISLYHEPQFSDGLFYQNSLGTLTYINMCGVTTTQCSPSSPVCQRTALWTTMGFGALNTQHMNKIEKSGVTSDQGVTVHYANGAECDGKRASSTVHVVCGTDETITSVTTSDDGCSVEVVISSSAGCGREVKYQGSAGGSVFPLVLLILILVGVALYFAVGMVVNWKVRGATTVQEMIPNRTFWISLPSMVVDGCKFIMHGCKKGDYVSV